MKFGIILPNYGDAASRMAVVDATLAAESLGYHSVWTTDHLALPQQDGDRFGRIFEAVTTLAYLAASARRIRLGVSSLVLPQRNPVEVAKQIATLDLLSGGRAMLAVGVGWSAGEYRNLGHNFHDRGKRMDEAIKVLRTLWRGGEVISFKGEYYSFEQLSFRPGTVQSGGPVLWVGGNSRVALRRALTLSDGWHPSHMGLDEMRVALKAHLPMLKVRPFTICNRMNISFKSGLEARAGWLSGDPQEVIDGLKAYAEAGMNYALLDFDAGNHAERERAMKRFAREVMPEMAQ